MELGIQINQGMNKDMKHRVCRMEESFQSDLLDTAIYQTKYRNYWLAISDRSTYYSYCLSTFSKSDASQLYCLGCTNVISNYGSSLKLSVKVTFGDFRPSCYQQLPQVQFGYC